uniref:RH46982p n=1 Tax=Drosophila melanogaster TaxID=7227 RepID=Q5U1D2_DROME|nr:RH46982p [Drosophila melanogaster]
MLSIFRCFSSHYCEGGGQTNAFVSMSVLNTALECREFRRKRHFCLAANTPRNMQHVSSSRHPSLHSVSTFLLLWRRLHPRARNVARTRTFHYSKNIVSKSTSVLKEFLFF